MATIEFREGYYYKEVNGIGYVATGGYTVKNNKVELLGSLQKKENNLTWWVPFYDDNYESDLTLKSAVAYTRNIYANLTVITVDLPLIANWVSRFGDSGVNFNGRIVVPNIPGVEFTVINNGFLTNGVEYTIGVKAKTGYTFAGITSPNVKYTPTGFTTPIKVISFDQALENLVKQSIRHTGANGKGTSIPGVFADFTVKISPAGGTQSNGDTLKIELVPKNQVRILGNKPIIYIIPANAFQNITSLTSSEIDTRWFGTIPFAGYNTNGTFTYLKLENGKAQIDYPFGYALFTPFTGLSDGDTISVDMFPKPGYIITDANQANGSFLNYQYTIPANTFTPNPNTIVDPVPIWETYKNSIRYITGGTISYGLGVTETATFSPTTGLKDGDTITISLAPASGYQFSGANPNSYSKDYVIPIGSFLPAPTIGPSYSGNFIGKDTVGVPYPGVFATAQDAENAFNALTTLVPDSLFPYQQKLTSISLPGVTSIGDNGFSVMSSLTSLSLPTCIKMGKDNFDDSSLVTVSLPKIQEIDKDCFSSSSTITTVILPEILKIGDECFRASNNITTLTIPKVISIGGGVYSGIKITTLNAPNLTDIGTGSFNECSLLTNIFLPKLQNFPARDFGSGVSVPCFRYVKNIAATTVTLPKKWDTINGKNQLFGGNGVGGAGGIPATEGWDKISFTWV